MNRNFLLVLILGVCFSSCSEKRTSSTHVPLNSLDTYLDVPSTLVAKSELYYDSKKSLWMINEQVYSGYAVSYYPDGTLKEKFGILNGRKQNQASQWFPDGHYKMVSNYKHGKLNGEMRAWSSDLSHTLLSQLNYLEGKLHGEQKKWYPTGELFKKLNFKEGKEEGLQQAFRENGALFANYEAREGRIYGLKKSVLCYGLEDEKMEYRRTEDEKVN
jgi:antitoxin component YwqK of YwqJK toxin-antitoxin module